MNTMNSVTGAVLCSVFLAGIVRANDSFNAELSHFIGNAALASVTTVAVDKYYPTIKNPAKVGFVVSATESLLGEVADKATGGHFSLLDVVVGSVGAAFGSITTDKWYIAPKAEIKKDETSFGIVASHKF